MQYEFDKKTSEAKIEASTKQAIAQATISQQKTKTNAMLGSAIILSIGAFFSFIFYKKRRDAKQLQQEAELRAEVSDTEMKALRAQMNPHFIFNALNSISDFISRNDLLSAQTYLAKFSKLMRAVLENSEQKEVALEEDLHALELYMQLEGARLRNNFSYEIHVAQNIDRNNTLIPPLILQPFVENSIWHGIGKRAFGKIEIRIEKENEMIKCTVEDNGVGLGKGDSEPREQKSMGMKITSSRLNILNQTNIHRASMKILDVEQGTRAEVRLPLKLSF